MMIYIPLTMGAPLTEDQEKEFQRAVVQSWVLYGQVHITNAPNGRGLSLLDPKGITYTPSQMVAVPDLGDTEMRPGGKR